VLKRALKAVVEHAGLDRLHRWLHRREAPILMYHGLTRDPACRDWTQVPVEAFERQMELLRERYRVVPLARLADMVAAGRVEPGSAAVTFDDGYRSVATLAAPVLRRTGVPATVFLTSGFIAETADERRTLWTDRVGLLLARSAATSVDLSGVGLPTYDLSTPEARR
jgi:peptidoglycan/xylan/chitin deacetylase (PgdA/CDA1 family)